MLFRSVEQGEPVERYQGIVELQGASLIDCVQSYFGQSEQIETGIKMAVGLREGQWRAGGIMLQKMPEEGGFEDVSKGNLDEDDWRRSMILMESCTEDEFLDTDLHSNILLMRLFHEEGVRVFEPIEVMKGCRCTDEKVESMLSMMSDDDLDYMEKDGQISMRCEFCSREYAYSRAHIDKLSDRKTQHSPVD